MADGNKLGATPLLTAFDVALTKDELEYVAAFLTDDIEKDDDAVRLLVGDGHAGYGLYAAHPEYPDEGAILVKNLPAPHGVAPSQAPSALAALKDLHRHFIAKAKTQEDYDALRAALLVIESALGVGGIDGR